MELFTPEGRKVICEGLNAAHSAAKFTFEETGRDELPEASFSVAADGSAVFKDGRPISDEEALAQRIQLTASVTFLVLFRRFFPENFLQNQNNLLCQFLKFLRCQATGPVF